MNCEHYFGGCKCLHLNATKIDHLQKILQHADLCGEKGIEEVDRFAQDVIRCDDLLQSIFSPVKAPLLNTAFCFDCANHHQTKYHTEGLDTHLLAVSILAKNFAAAFYEKFYELFASETFLTESEFIILCETAGLFHDIGKPLVRNQVSRNSDKVLYTGHAQIGARLINQVSFDSEVSTFPSLKKELELLERYKICLEWAINHHMCSCTHMHEVSDYLPQIGLHLMMDLGGEDSSEESSFRIKSHRVIAFALLSVLSYADHVGRLSIDLEELQQELQAEASSVTVSETVRQHSYSLFEKLLVFEREELTSLNAITSALPEYNGKLIIITYGFSGSGKSYTVQRLKEQFGHDYDIIHVERDNSLLQVYEKQYGSAVGKSYEEVYATVYGRGEEGKDESEATTSTATTNASIKPGKTLVQEQWVQDIADGLETLQEKAGQIIIIDSVQPLFPSQWQSTIHALKMTSEEAYNAYLHSPKIGYYTIPIHMFGDHIASARSLATKTGKWFLMPPAESDHIRGIYYPNLYTEKEVNRGSSKSQKVAKGIGEGDPQTSMSTPSNLLSQYFMDEQTLLYATGSYTLLQHYITQYFQYQQYNLAQQIAFIQGEQSNNHATKSTASNAMIQQNIITIFYRIHYELINHRPREESVTPITFEELFKHFLQEFLHLSKGHIPFIHYKVELETSDYQLITIYYDDGLQTFTGTTRDYRGEGLVFHRTTGYCYSIRPSLPVFPEMASIQKDPKTFPYLFPIWDSIENFQNPLYQQIKRSLHPNQDYQLYLIPKYDGSLFNLTFIHQSNTVVYQMMRDLITANEEKVSHAVTSPLYASYYFYQEGLFLIGSKGTILSKNPVNERIHRAILGSYESIEQFLDITYRYLITHPTLFPVSHSVITLHYEAIDAVPSSELTVYYNRAWCPYFGCTVYHQLSQQKSFHLPLNDYYPSEFRSIATVYDCQQDWHKVFQYYQENYERLLNGDEEMEPEGYVLHIFGKKKVHRKDQTEVATEDGKVEKEEEQVITEWLPIKYKYTLYYTAHKPQSKHHLNMALELTSNPKYEKICQRLAKFRAKPSISQIFTDHSFLFEQMVVILQQVSQQLAVEEPTTAIKTVTKKAWALYWRDQTTTNYQTMVQVMETLQQALMIHYEQYKEMVVAKMLFSLLMKAYDYLLIQTSLTKVDGMAVEEWSKFIEEYLLA